MMCVHDYIINFIYNKYVASYLTDQAALFLYRRLFTFTATHGEYALECMRVYSCNLW